MINKYKTIIISTLFFVLIYCSTIERVETKNNSYFLENNALLVYWSLDEGNGAIAHDYSGHILNGTINGATWTDGYSGYALNFDGINDYIDLDEHSYELGFNKTDDYKISAWIKTESNNMGIIYMISDNINPIPIFYIKINNNGTIEMKVQATESCGITLNSPNSYNDGSWHFIEGIYHGNENYPEMDIYVDNKLVASGSDWVCSLDSNQFSAAKIGMTSYNSINGFLGSIDEIKIFKRPNQNEPPNSPQISGPSTGTVNEIYNYNFITTDLENDESYLWVDWGDYTNTGWIGPYNSNENVLLSHSWSNEGIYQIKAISKDIFDVSECGSLIVEIDDTYVPPHIPGGDDNTSGHGNQTINDTPKANASLSQTKGTIGTPIMFDGSKSSDSDGIITGYRWDFTSDGTYETDWLTNPKIVYTYKSEGIFKVTLQVKDNNNSTDLDQINVSISNRINNPPTKPIINGINIGTRNSTVTLSFVSTDSDNDYLQYNISWGDSQKTSSEFLASGFTTQISHNWNNAGIYTINAYAFDNKTISETTNYIILIDAYFVKKTGYLLDTNSDGIYDVFHLNSTTTETMTKKTSDGYLLDYDDDGNWDHLFNLPSDLLSSYTEEKNSEKTPGFEIILIVFAITLVLIMKRIGYKRR